MTRDGFLEKALERRIVAGTFKKNRAFGCSVENVEYESSRSLSGPSRHSADEEATSVPNRGVESVL
jgi:hypothetical protein